MRSAVVGEWFWIPRTHRAARLRLVCYPHAGGDAAIYAGLATALPDWVEVWSVRLPGRGARIRQPRPPSLDHLLRANAAAVRQFVAPPFVLAGQSFGAVLAFELCHELGDECSPVGLVVAAAPAPDFWPEADMPRTREDLVTALRLLGDEAPQLSADPTVAELALATMKADLELWREPSRPRRRLSLPIHALSGARDSTTMPRHMSAWSRHTSGPFRLSILDAGHFPLQSHPVESSAAVHADLGRWLDGADRS